MGNQRVVVDQLLLRLEPLCPARLADRVVDPLAEVIGKRLERLPFPFQSAPGAVNRCHQVKLAPSYSPRLSALTPLAVPRPVAPPTINAVPNPNRLPMIGTIWIRATTGVRITVARTAAIHGAIGCRTPST